MKKVAIVGFASTKDQAPYMDPEFEIWTLNDMSVPRATRWFEMHKREVYESRMKRSQLPDDWLQTSRIPIYMQEKRDEIPQSIEYPIKDYIAKYRDYYTNTVSYMIAMAIAEDFQEIHLYGVDMAQNTEYSEQRPSVEYWLGFAEGRGIKIYIPSQSDLLKQSHRYGYETLGTIEKKIKDRTVELQKRLDGIDETKEQLINLFLNDLFGRAGEEVQCAISGLRDQLNSLAYEKLFVAGCLDENKYIRGVFL